MDNKFPISGKGQRITCTNSNVFTQFTTGDLRNRSAASTNIMVHNLGAVTVHVISGSNAAPPTADNTCMPIAPNEKRVFSKPNAHDGLACLSSGANSDILVFTGSGD